MNDLSSLFSLSASGTPHGQQPPPPPTPISGLQPCCQLISIPEWLCMTFWAFALFKALTQEQQPIKSLPIIMPLSQHSKRSRLTLSCFVSLLVTHVCSPLLMSSGQPGDKIQPLSPPCLQGRHSTASESDHEGLSWRHILLKSPSCIWGHLKFPPALCDPEQLLPLSRLPPGMS